MRDEIRKTKQCWCDMKQRCLNERHAQFKNYGGRGIRICDAWLESFDAFLRDVGVKPNGLTLDRIDNDGNYEPGNVRWATRAEQRSNQRGIHTIMVDGEALPLDIAARRLGIHRATLQTRLRLGWTVGAAISRPVQPQRDHRPSAALSASGKVGQSGADGRTG